MNEPMLAFTYQFYFDDKKTKTFEAFLNPDTLSLALPVSYRVPAWAKTFRCSQSPPEDTCCNIYENISHLIEDFKSLDSFIPCTISVHTPERNYSTKADVQRGLSSLLGLYMATSGCPFLNFLKPMARFHLPFASNEETIFRSTGSYLIGQYLKAKKNNQADFEINQLPKMYNRVSKINNEIIAHLRQQYYAHDANANALIMLENFAQIFSEFLPEELEEFVPFYEQDYNLKA
ncbi:MAG TPA: hypothetical protein VK564_02935 [Thermodesulfobacteriota bacterium]|nr:hypothetical protein [Thermodesulfobacteriota bacterium]